VGDADAGKTVAPAVDGNDANAVRDAALPPTDAQSAVTCPAGPGLAAGDHKLSLQHEGRSRTYLLHVPKSYDGTKPRPLVLDFHGYSRTSAGQKAASGWDAVSDREGLLVAYPDGVGSSWNVGGCCGSAGTSNIDDVGFARALVAQLATQLCVDLKRVYASGVSNGAGISARLGCEAADLFAGVALVSSDLRTQPCQPRRPITEIAFRGTGDTLEPYEGGLVGPVGMQFQSPGARGSFELWKNINRCTGAPIASVKLCETYTECAEGVEVTLCTMPGVGHSPYDNNLSFDIAQTTWDAYQRAPAH
jgi:polyhydroxybutyrate depolymerase